MEIRNYDNLEQIAVGGTSVVYRAWDLRHDRHVAIKILNQTSDEATDRERFANETRLLGRLGNHANIVTVLDSGFTDSNHPYIVTPYFDDGTYAEAQRRGPLPWREVADIGAKLAGALATVHGSDVLHRDIKPGNVFVGHYDSGPVLGDFGISSTADPSRPTTANPALTLLFAAPEVLESQRATEASDLYSLGATLVALLNAQPAFWDTSPAVITRRVLDPDLEPNLPDDTPADLAELLRSMMAFDPDRRPASAIEVKRRFEALLSDPLERTASPNAAVGGGVLGASDGDNGAGRSTETEPWSRAHGRSRAADSGAALVASVGAAGTDPERSKQPKQSQRNRHRLLIVGAAVVALAAVAAGVALAAVVGGDDPTVAAAVAGPSTESPSVPDDEGDGDGDDVDDRDGDPDRDRDGVDDRVEVEDGLEPAATGGRTADTDERQATSTLTRAVSNDPTTTDERRTTTTTEGRTTTTTRAVPNDPTTTAERRTTTTSRRTTTTGGATTTSRPATTTVNPTTEPPADPCDWTSPASFVENFTVSAAASTGLYKSNASGCEPVNTMSAGEKFTVIASEGGWYYGRTSSGLSRWAPASAFDNLTCDWEDPSNFVSNFTVTATRDGGLYKLPNDSCDPIATLAAGSEFKVIATKGSWYYGQTSSGLWRWMRQSAFN